MNSLLKLRKNSGLTQQAVADYIGVSRGLINLVEKGLRELPKEAKTKLDDIEKGAAIMDGNRNSMSEIPEVEDDKITKQLKDYHKLKIEEYSYKVQTLLRQLAAITKSLQKTNVKLKVVNGMAKNNFKTGKNKVDNIWTEYHGQISNKKLSKHYPAMRMLNDDIDTMNGYIAVHEKILKKIY